MKNNRTKSAKTALGLPVLGHREVSKINPRAGLPIVLRAGPNYDTVLVTEPNAKMEEGCGFGARTVKLTDRKGNHITIGTEAALDLAGILQRFADDAGLHRISQSDLHRMIESSVA
jgi:hypothetical protein